MSEAELRNNPVMGPDRKGRYDGADAEYGQPILLSPKNTDAWDDRGRATYLSGPGALWAPTVGYGPVTS